MLTVIRAEVCEEKRRRRQMDGGGIDIATEREMEGRVKQRYE